MWGGDLKKLEREGKKKGCFGLPRALKEKSEQGGGIGIFMGCLCTGSLSGENSYGTSAANSIRRARCFGTGTHGGFLFVCVCVCVCVCV